MKTLKNTTKLILAMGCWLVLSQSASAVIITDLYNTGVDNSGNALPTLAVDGHYTITSPSQVAIVPISTPGSWFPDNSNSQWIVPEATPFGSGSYVYETTFSLPAVADLSSVVITGLWGTDNQGLDILVNGGSTGLTNTIQFTSLTPFTLDNSNSTFVVGTNTIEFELNNISSFTGLRIDEISGTFAVPEPTGFGLLAAFAVFGFPLRRLF